MKEWMCECVRRANARAPYDIVPFVWCGWKYASLSVKCVSSSFCFLCVLVFLFNIILLVVRVPPFFKILNIDDSSTCGFRQAKVLWLYLHFLPFFFSLFFFFFFFFSSHLDFKLFLFHSHTSKVFQGNDSSFFLLLCESVHMRFCAIVVQIGFERAHFSLLTIESWGSFF